MKKNPKFEIGSFVKVNGMEGNFIVHGVSVEFVSTNIVNKWYRIEGQNITIEKINECYLEQA